MTRYYSVIWAIRDSLGNSIVRRGILLGCTSLAIIAGVHALPI